MKEQPESELYAELAALRQRLNNLEAEREAAQYQARCAQRPTFLRKCLLGPLPLALLVLGGGLLYAQGDALFIDQDGKVGILNSLSVKKDLTVEGDVRTGGQLFADKLKVIGQLSTDSLITKGNVDIGDTSSAATLRIGSPLPDLLLGGMPSPQNSGLRLHYAKELKVGVLDVTGDSFRLRGFTTEGHQTDRMTFDLKTGHVGIGANAPQARLHVGGNARIDGGVTSKARYQRNDDAETAYDLSPRYHLSVSANKFNGTTIAIPRKTLTDLCGDPDGCQVRLGMTRWVSDSQEETASRSFLFYYAPTYEHWRSDYGDRSGVIGNGKTEHAAEIWDTCFFTDGTYVNKKDNGDILGGMALLVWEGTDKNPHRNPNRTCELTLID